MLLIYASPVIHQRSALNVNSNTTLHQEKGSFSTGLFRAAGSNSQEGWESSCDDQSPYLYTT
jgi:hypothetical protein